MQRSAAVPQFPDGTRVWKERFTADDQLYQVRRFPGRLVHVMQDSMRLCDMPGTYSVQGGGGHTSQNAPTVSFEATTMGQCEGQLHARNGINLGPPFAITREHIGGQGDTRPGAPKFAVLSNGAAGGAQYRMPVEAETWQHIMLSNNREAAAPVSGRRLSHNSGPAGAFMFGLNPVPMGTVLSAIEQTFDYNPTYQVNNVNFDMVVAATTHQITIEIDRAEMLSMLQAEVAADPRCDCPAPCDRQIPYWCTRYDCESTPGGSCLPSCTGHCHTFYGHHMRRFQKLRAQPSGGATTGDLVAERIITSRQNSGSPRNETMLIQCIETAGDRTSATSQWEPQNVGTVTACGLTAGTWLRGPDTQMTPMGESEELLFGRIISIDQPDSLLVTTSHRATGYGNYFLQSPAVLYDQSMNGSQFEVTNQRFNFQTWNNIVGNVTAQPAGDARVNYTIRSVVGAETNVSGLKCLTNCIVPELVGTSANPPENNSVVHNYGVCSHNDCNVPDPNAFGTPTVPQNLTFDEYFWRAGLGMMKCSGDPSVVEASSDDAGSGAYTSIYSAEQCTQSAAVPANTLCSINNNGPEPRCDNWRITSVLFRDRTASDFACSESSDASSSSETTESFEGRACLTTTRSGRGSQQFPNVADLDEYWEYVTGVPYHGGSMEDTIWLEAPPESAAETILLEPPLQLTLRVPCGGEPIQSLSGTDYRCKRFVVSFNDGIDVHNSPGFPMWCLNRNTGETRAPITSNYGHQTCNSPGYQMNDYHELFPDLAPDLSWAGTDGLNRNWGLKPAEKTIIYSIIGQSNCSNPITNPVVLGGQPNDRYRHVDETLRDPVANMRTQLADLKTWFTANSEDRSALRIVTGEFVGSAANFTPPVTATPIVPEVGSGEAAA